MHVPLQLETAPSADAGFAAPNPAAVSVASSAAVTPVRDNRRPTKLMTSSLDVGDRTGPSADPNETLAAGSRQRNGPDRSAWVPGAHTVGAHGRRTRPE